MTDAGWLCDRLTDSQTPSTEIAPLKLRLASFLDFGLLGLDLSRREKIVGTIRTKKKGSISNGVGISRLLPSTHHSSYILGYYS